MAKLWSLEADVGAVPDAPEPTYPNTQWRRRPGVDPYFRWALHTEWRGFARLAGWNDSPEGPPKEIRIIAAVCDEGASQTQVKRSLEAITALGKEVIQLPTAYLHDIPGTGSVSRFVTATVPKHQARWLLANPLGLRWKLAMPMRDAERVAQASAKGLFGPDRDRKSMQGTNVLAAEIRAAAPLDPPQPLPSAIALIDNGCPFLNLAFASRQGSRVAALWDQGSEARPDTDASVVDATWPWRRPAGFGYGRELGPRALNTMARAARRRTDVDETMVYRGIDHLIDYDDPRRRIWFATHGGHLLHMAGGVPDPINGETTDPAASAALVFVQLPLLAAMDSGGASLAPHILDGVRYAMGLVGAGDPLVVSISYGGQAGPHDGSSLVEEALQELLDQRQVNFAVVLAAGNARLARAHASRLLRKDRSVLLRCQMPEGDTTDSFVEVWYEPPGAEMQVEFRVRTPDQLWSPWVAAGKEALFRESGFEVPEKDEAILAAKAQTRAEDSQAPARMAGKDVIALLRHDLHVPNGKRALALLALAPTARPADVLCALAQPGVWEIEVRLAPPARKPGGPPADLSAPPAPVEPTVVRIDAWIERDDPGLGSGAQRPFFIDQVPDDDLDTLSSLANNAVTIRAGGFNLGTGRPAPYSALGSPARGGPDVLAACEEDEVETSIAATATRSGEICRLNGTSVAAPVLARRLFNLMSMGEIGRGQWPAVLQELAADPGEPAIKAVPSD